MTYDSIMSQLPQQESAFASCFAFSIHKCGSSMMHSMIAAVCKQMDLPAISLPDTFFQNGILEDTWANDPEVLPMFSKNLLYFGFRWLPPIFLNGNFDFRDKRFVLLVRDPRDALVSQYFSYGRKAASHVLPKNNPEAYQAVLASMGDSEIDEYVIRAAGGIKRKFISYQTALDFDLGLLRRYEDIYFDKETFLREIFTHFGMDIPPDIIARVAKSNDIRPAQEDETKHIRKGTPGDHAEKLRPETIARLNDIFRDVGAFYGYKR